MVLPGRRATRGGAGGANHHAPGKGNPPSNLSYPSRLMLDNASDEALALSTASGPGRQEKPSAANPRPGEGGAHAPLPHDHERDRVPASNRQNHEDRIGRRRATPHRPGRPQFLAELSAAREACARPPARPGSGPGRASPRGGPPWSAVRRAVPQLTEDVATGGVPERPAIEPPRTGHCGLRQDRRHHGAESSRYPSRAYAPPGRRRAARPRRPRGQGPSIREQPRMPRRAPDHPPWLVGVGGHALADAMEPMDRP